jgi:hypothetical protein
MVRQKYAESTPLRAPKESLCLEFFYTYKKALTEGPLNLGNARPKQFGVPWLSVAAITAFCGSVVPVITAGLSAALKGRSAPLRRARRRPPLQLSLGGPRGSPSRSKRCVSPSELPARA